MKEHFSRKKITPLIVRAGIWLIVGLTATSFFFVPMMGSTLLAKPMAKAADPFCNNDATFSNLKGLTSLGHAKAVCQTLVNLINREPDLQIMLKSTDFANGLVSDINATNNTVFSGSTATEIKPQLMIMGNGCPSGTIVHQQTATQDIVKGAFGITATVEQYHLDSPGPCVYSVVWDTRSITPNGKSVNGCLLGIPYPSGAQNKIGGVLPRGLQYQLNSYGGRNDRSTFTKETLLYIRSLPFDLQSVTTQLDSSVVVGQSVDLSSVFIHCP